MDTLPQRLFVKQRFEPGELFGIETRNKYVVTDERGQQVAYCAEEARGWLGAVARQFLGHFRAFDLHFFAPDRAPVMVAHHPFRWLFQRLEVMSASGDYLGSLQQRFSLVSKRFDVRGPGGELLFEMSSPLWRPWTFPFVRIGTQVAQVTKKWTGLFAEAFTDKDTFAVEYQDPGLTEAERLLVLAAAVFIDLQYFEKKAD